MLGLMLQWGGFGGFSFTDLLNQLNSFGFFAYVLPFLLIFAVVYAILTRINIFTENKGAAVIVALAVGLLALQLDYVPAFFQSIFPSLGIGISILLAALILTAAFITDQNKAYSWIFFGIGGAVFLIIVLTSLSSQQFIGSWQWRDWWFNYGGLVLFLLIIAGVIVAVTVANRGSTPSTARHT